MRKLLLLLCFASLPVFAVEPEFFQTSKVKIPNPAAQPTIKSVGSGLWSMTSNWDCNCVPSLNDVVKIEPGHVITYNMSSNVELSAIGVEGSLMFDHTTNTLLHVTDIIVYPDGYLEIGNDTNPIAGNIKANIVFNDVPLDLINDPTQENRGLVVFGGFKTRGEDRGSHRHRIVGDVLAGQTSITFETDASKWKVGDRIVIPATNQTHLVKRWSTEALTLDETQETEIVVISSFTGTNTINLVNPTQYNHYGITSNDGSKSYTAHAYNLDRNIVLESENQNGTRAHGLATSRSDVHIHGVLFKGMGRTTSDPLDNTTFDAQGNVTNIGANQIGRYPWHFHHYMGLVNPTNTGYQFTFESNSIEDGLKWGISVHNSHFGLVDDNICFDVTGSCYMTEEGNERENFFTNNSAVFVGGRFKHEYQPRYGGVAGLDPFRPLGFADFGYEGTGFWYNGLDNYVFNNVAADCRFAGHMANERSGGGFGILTPRVPNIRGSDIDDPAQWTQYTQYQFPPSIRQFENNESYATAEGHWVSFSGKVGTIKGAVAWATHQKGIYSTRNSSVTFEDPVMLSRFNDSYASSYLHPNKAVDAGNSQYATGHSNYIRGHFEGFVKGVELPFAITVSEPLLEGYTPPRTIVFEDSFFRNYVNVKDNNPIGDGTSTPYSKEAHFNNVVFETVPGAPIEPALGVSPVAPTPHNFYSSIFGSSSKSGLMILNRVLVTSYNGVGGNDFEIFWPEQAPDFVIPVQTGTYHNPADNCPTAGMTNQQCRDAHGVSLLGAIATCSDQVAGIRGFACGTTPTPGGPLVVNAGSDVTINEGGTVTINGTVTGGSGSGQTCFIDWGDGTAIEACSIVNGSFNASRIYLDGSDSKSIAVVVADDGGNSASDSVIVTVNNVQPVGVIVGTGTVLLNQPYTITTTITDPGNDTITQYLVDWGDGSAVETIAAGNPLVHTYTDSCSYTISVSVTDEDVTNHFIGTHDVNVTCACGQ